MNHVFKFKSRLWPIACAILVAMLGACGGGGGGDTTSTAAPTPTGDNTPAPVVPVMPVAPPPDPVVNASIVTSVPVPTYAAASEELAAFNLLNAERERCGFGLMAQNTALDMA